MYQFFVEENQINKVEKQIIILGDDVNHMKNVLRMKPGEEFLVSNGQDDLEYHCTIEEFSWDQVLCQILFVKEANVELSGKIYLFQALPKADKMELIIQKAVELGAYQIVPVATKRCVVKLDEKKARAKVQRWQEIAKAAAKQSKRAVIPEVTEPMSLEKALKLAEELDVRLIPYEMAEGMQETKRLISQIHSGQSIGIFIGPEGGFDPKEIEGAMAHHVLPITLGKRILRTETAGLAIISWIMYQLEE